VERRRGPDESVDAPKACAVSMARRVAELSIADTALAERHGLLARVYRTARCKSA
jgi:hypothetical protein